MSKLLKFLLLAAPLSFAGAAYAQNAYDTAPPPPDVAPAPVYEAPPPPPVYNGEPAPQPGVKQDIKNGAHDVKRGAKTAKAEVKSGSKEAWHGVKDGTKHAWSATKDGAHEAKAKIKHAFKGDESASVD
jgi:hypothetical protein